MTPPPDDNQHEGNEIVCGNGTVYRGTHPDVGPEPVAHVEPDDFELLREEADFDRMEQGCLRGLAAVLLAIVLLSALAFLVTNTLPGSTGTAVGWGVVGLATICAAMVLAWSRKR